MSDVQLGEVCSKLLPCRLPQHEHADLPGSSAVELCVLDALATSGAHTLINIRDAVIFVPT